MHVRLLVAASAVGTHTLTADRVVASAAVVVAGAIGIVGGYAAVVVGLIAAPLGGLARARSRSTT